MITKGLTAGFLIYVVIVWLIHDFGYLLSPVDYLLLSFSCLFIGETIYPTK
jgi:type IV secretory pathway TrbD component